MKLRFDVRCDEWLSILGRENDVVEEIGVGVRHVDLARERSIVNPASLTLLIIVLSYARFGRCRPLRGLCGLFCMSGPGVPLRYTPGFTLSPAPRALRTFLHEWSWGSASLHPRLYAATRSAGFADFFACVVLG